MGVAGMSSLPQTEAEPVGLRGPPRSQRYLPHVLVATAVVSLLPIAIVWALRDRGVISSPWVALPLAVLFSLLAAAVGSAWWSRRRRADDLMFSELLLWGWLRRLYIEHQVERAVRLLSSAHPVDHPGNEDLTVERRAQLLSGLAAALEAQDPYLEGHSRRVARHATMIARKIGLDADEVSKLRAAAVLHDVGKLHVPQELLNKPGRLSAAEFDQVKRHADEGAKLVAGLGDDHLTSIVRHHHERLDGTGYPDGLRGSYIPLGARIIAVADMYDAITAARPYRPAAPHKQALDTLREESLTHLDPSLVHAFRSSYAGRGPLAFWESLAAWIQAVPFASHGAPVPVRRLSLRDVVATTLTTALIAVAAIAAPIGGRIVETHRAAATTAPPVALTHRRAAQRMPALARPHSARAHARRSTRSVVHRGAASASLPLAVPRSPQTGTAGRGPTLGTAKIRSSPHRTVPRSPSTQPPRTTAHQPPGRPRPRPTSPRPPTTTPVSPPQITPATPGNAPAQTTTPSPAPPSTATITRPTSKNACKNGGYVQYGFSNQGQCVAAVEHGG